MQSPDDPVLRKRNVRLAWMLALAAAAILVGFVWVQAAK